MSSVTDVASYNELKNANAGNENVRDLEYIGKTGVVQQGHINGEESNSGAFQLNADGTATQLEYGTGNLSATQADPSNAEPGLSTDAMGQALAAAGTMMSTLEQGALAGRTGVVNTMKITESVDDFARLSDASTGLRNVGKVASKSSTVFGAAGIVATVVDAGVNGAKPHHYADVIIGGLQTFALGSGPVGWGLGVAWMAADLISVSMDGKSLTERWFDPK